jgi:hypothetical protein
MLHVAPRIRNVQPIPPLASGMINV